MRWLPLHRLLAMDRRETDRDESPAVRLMREVRERTRDLHHQIDEALQQANEDGLTPMEDALFPRINRRQLPSRRRRL
jgi:hypothetical protein